MEKLKKKRKFSKFVMCSKKIITTKNFIKDGHNKSAI